MTSVTGPGNSNMRVAILSLIILRSRRPFTGALSGECPKVLRRVLSECFLGIPRKCPGECLRECLENWECPRECSRECFSLGKNEERHSREHSRFSRHSRRHFLGVPQKHSESTRRSTSGHSPESTPVNGRRDGNSQSI